MGGQFRRDPEVSLRHIATAETVATEQRLMLQFDARVLRGGATMVQGTAQEGGRGNRDGLAARATGTGIRSARIGPARRARRCGWLATLSAPSRP